MYKFSTKALISIIIIAMVVTVIPIHLNDSFAESNSSNVSDSTDNDTDYEVTDDAIDDPKENNDDPIKDDSENRSDKNNISPQAADTKEYITLKMNEGSQSISGVSQNANWTSGSTRIATFKDGKVYAHAQGSTIVKIDQTSGGKKWVYVTSSYMYPQPKTSIVQTRGDGVKLTNWAGDPEDNFVSSQAKLNEGDRLKVLWRSRTEGDSDTELMQYVETPQGYRGYVRSNLHSDRPFDAYYTDLKLGETTYKYFRDADEILETADSWVSANSSIATATKTTDPNTNKANQGRIKGVKEGLTTVTASMKYDNKNMNTTCTVAVYTPIANARGVILNDNTVIRVNPSKDYNAVQVLNKDQSVTINGVCGDYWRVGENRFVHKKDVYIPIVDMRFEKSTMDMTLGSEKELKLVVTPEIANTDSIELKSSKSSVATRSEDGIVKAKKVGKTTISAICTPSSLETQCLVNVKPRPSMAGKTKYATTLYLDLKRAGNKYNEIAFSVYGMSKDRTNPAKYYRLYRKSSAKGKYKIITDKISTSTNKVTMIDSTAKEGKFYIYMIVAFPEKKKGLVAKKHGVTFETLIINKGGKTKPKLKAPKKFKVKKSKKANQLTLSWKRVKGVTGYKIYRLKPGDKSYVFLRTVSQKKSKTIKFTDKNLKGKKKYYYRIISYKKQRWASNNKYWSTYISKRNPAVGSSKKVMGKPKTKRQIKVEKNARKAKKIEKQTMKYFKSKWNFVKIERTGTEVNQSGDQPIKYNYNKGELQIHLYVKYKGPNQNSKLNTLSGKNKELFASALTGGGNRFTTNVNGRYIKDKYGKFTKVKTDKTISQISDFKWTDKKGKQKKIIFKTRVVLHTSNKSNSKQKYINVQFGGNCPRDCGYGNDGRRWPHAHYSDNDDYKWSRDYSSNMVYLPTNEQIKKNKDKEFQTKLNSSSYKAVAAHEMCHILGLDDAYRDKDDGTLRLVRNYETTKKFAFSPMETNIMEYENYTKYILPNDLEMMLQAYKKCDRVKSYRCYKKKSHSRVIRSLNKTHRC